jgi:hypothetical protein
MKNTAYVYDKATGYISYTIDNPNAKQISNMSSQGINYHLDSPGHSIFGTYVTVNTITQQTEGIEKVKDIEDYIVCTDTRVVANGTHEVVVSNLKIGSAVIIHDTKGDVIFIPDEFDTTLEFTANQISTNSNENMIKYTIHEYGYNPKTYYLPIVEE